MKNEQSPFESPDDLAVHRAMKQAELEDRNVDDASARRIAAQLHTGQDSAMYSLASSGAVDQEALAAEVHREYWKPDTDERMKRMYNHISTYAIQHAGRGPVEGWYKLTDDQERDSNQTPEVWLGCLAARNAGITHGMWFNALQEPDELQEDVDAMLASSPMPDSDEHYVDDSRNFYGLEFDEEPSVEEIAELARLVHEHGEAIVCWLNWTGYDRTDGLGNLFSDAYHGQFPSVEKYVDHVLNETEAYDFIKFAPEDIQPHVTVDLKALAQRWQQDGLLVIESEAGDSVFIYSGTV